ncbi:unnamed protein product [Spirodela intermedia]|uniref:Uncharacterized protein n=1 Tax=Spirodela intermedia TaxID=51605 RepID=A0A7I8KTV9_SPIIN|nr:unnamed protein product [Spirodela intermedia]
MERLQIPYHHRRHDFTATEAKSHQPNQPHHHHHPSFSSCLLDAIDQSIDKGGGGGGGGGGRCAADGAGSGGAASARLRCSSRVPADEKKRVDQRSYPRHAAHGRGAEDRRFAGRVSEKVAPPPRHRGATAEYEQRQPHRSRARERDRFCGNSTSSSSESSYGGFSSSEAESVVRSTRHLPKPIRTGGTPERKAEQKMKGSIRSRFRASKVNGETRNGRTPVSPGARLAGFLNSLFSTATHPKKAKIISTASNSAVRSVIRGGDESGCSSASSFSRSYLSKPASSGGGAAAAAKRSVRFIVEEDYLPVCHEPHYLPHLTAIRVREEPPLPPPLSSNLVATAVAEERKRVAEKARKLITAYEEKERSSANALADEEEEDEDDDAASYCSSDLFELKDLSAIGGGGGGGDDDELPVYETTHFSVNHAVSRGIIV